jgi:hypothetical protein
MENTEMKTSHTKEDIQEKWWLLTGSLRPSIDLCKTWDVPSSNKMRTCTVAAEAALAAAAAAWAAAAAASFAFLEEPPFTTSGILGGNALSTKAYLSRQVSHAKSFPVPESTTDQSLAL